jgi:hypothetical protein
MQKGTPMRFVGVRRTGLARTAALCSLGAGLLSFLASCNKPASTAMVAGIPREDLATNVITPTDIGLVQGGLSRYVGETVTVRGVVAASYRPGIFVLSQGRYSEQRIMVILNTDVPPFPPLGLHEMVQVTGRVETFSPNLPEFQARALAESGPPISPNLLDSWRNKAVIVGRFTRLDHLTP